MIGQRLKLARAASGFSLRDLSDAIGNLVTAQAIGKYERDEAMPGSAVLMALAESLDVSIEYLMADPDLVLEGLEFRKKSLTTKKEESRIEAQVLDRLDRYLTVEDVLGLPSVEWDRPREAPYPVVRELSEAGRGARSLRAQWGLGFDPIPNVMELLEERGIKVLSVALDNIDGMTAKVRRRKQSFAPVIVVNRSQWGERQRFTAAHELGHLVLDVKSELNEEDAAHRFAGAFLMPAESIWSLVGKHRKSISIGELIDLKRLFGVSIQAIAYRCKDLGIIAQTTYRALFKEFNRRGWRRPPYQEPWAMNPETPNRFERLCMRAAAERVVSDSKAAELLGISVRDLEQRMESPGEGVSIPV